MITGFNAVLPQQLALPTDPPASPVASQQAPSTSAASAMLTSLCCNIRQGITQMAHMRCCILCAGAPPSQVDSMAVFVTNAGGIGLVQRLPKWLTAPLCNLQEMLASGNSGYSGEGEQGPVWPPRASAHHHKSAWCSYSYKEPYCDKSQWQARITSATDELYNGGPVKGFTAQCMAIDAELLKSWMLHAEENGMHIRKASNRGGDMSKIPWRAIKMLSHLRIFGLLYVAHVRSLEKELVKM
jgi:hypothetical protein